MQNLKLSELEKEIFNHRLEVPDALHDALTSDKGATQWFWEDVCNICELLLEQKWEEAYEYNQDLMNEVLIDCVEGSTYWRASFGNVNGAKLRWIKRAGQKLAKKIQEFMGIDRELEFPLY